MMTTIAASLLLLLGTVTVYLFRQPAVHYVNNGRTARHLLLPDYHDHCQRRNL